MFSLGKISEMIPAGQQGPALFCKGELVTAAKIWSDGMFNTNK